MKRFFQNLGLLSARPALFTRGIANYGALVLGRPVLRALDLEITHRCPCRCVQCYAYVPSRPGAPELTVPEIANLVEQARALGALQVLLSGGEPLVRPDLTDIIAAAQPNRMLVTMCTSGVGLTRERVFQLAEVGLAVLVFSVDSIDPTTHDHNRGVAGLHARVLAAAGYARESGMRVIFNTVATKAKLARDEIYQLAELAARHGATLNLTIPTPQGRWQANDEVVLGSTERDRLTVVLRHSNIRTDVDSSYGRRRCPAAVEKVSIDPYGNVRPCPLVPLVWGNIRSDTLSAVWTRMRAHPGLKKRSVFCPAADLAFRRRHPDLFELISRT